MRPGQKLGSGHYACVRSRFWIVLSTAAFVVIAAFATVPVEGRSSTRVVALTGATGEVTPSTGPTVESTSSTVAVLATTSTTKPAEQLCTLPLQLVTLGDTPQTITVTSGEATQYLAPVGTVFVVHLSHGTNCNGPYWSLPTAGPSSVVSQVRGTQVSAGATAEGTFEVVGPGDGKISFPGTCGPITSGCVPLGLDLQIVARAATAAAPTTLALPHTG